MNVAQSTTEYTEKLRQALHRDTTLRSLAAQATTRYAGEKARIDRGLVLALNGHVTLHADGTASVQSGTDAEVTYTVNGQCDCPDVARAPEGRCKHRWAKCLVKRAISFLAFGNSGVQAGEHVKQADAYYTSTTTAQGLVLGEPTPDDAEAEQMYQEMCDQDAYVAELAADNAQAEAQQDRPPTTCDHDLF